MKSLFYFIENHSINWPLIWSDSSIYVCFWLICMMFLVMWAANNYKYSVRKEAEEHANSAIRAMNLELDNLVSENSYLKQAFRSYKEDMQHEVLRLNKLIPKRNEDGTFAVTTGKGHGKKKAVKEIDWTKASKEELLAEAKRRYKKGDIVSCLKGYANKVTVNHSEKPICYNDQVWIFADCNGNNICVFYEGVWAEIIKS